MSGRGGSATAVRRNPGARGRSGTTSRRPARRPARGRRPNRRDLAGWVWVGVVVLVVVLLAVSARATRDDLPMATAECTLPATGMRLTGEQVGNARTIAQVGFDRGLPHQAVVIALATAMQESSLRNLPYGDRDSLGLFQQRPSQGWGTPEQVQDPVYAAGIFYDRLVQVPGWEGRRVTDAAQIVQRSAFPEAYQRWATMAEELTAALSGGDRGCP
ncbi:hypothetical protein ACI8AC_14370 [Geodermatophilus sp. SYSU D00758]